ncbi:EamA family transporter [Phocoenobacter skyensis]|uniref:EamA family transporter n=1 Tax=Phocoenobacter skyensis TaxID=97481 RepID=A0A1H7ZY38_9PAST|nr:EamA family transporter [Pasteurella skyensis]MDP8080360.1 EamA family transporter [Pasteurella skyensis]MDP8086350.1 EamA family transporter [Pasteurella skyensis]MDP8171116.1 EamA family transporter [Pasteurella skyensis]MDP8173853.1 EamA family transporter [Pasteurella skyensis]MDP8186072.1 EamA family transporter [Pasteurella skyensis]
MKFTYNDLLIGIFVAILWGVNFVPIKLGLQSLDPFAFTFLRFFFSAFPAVFFIKRPSNVSWRTLIIYGVLFGCGLWWTAFYAIHNGLSGGMASLFMQFSAFFTIGLSYLLLKEKVNLVQIIGSLIALFGLFLMILVTDGSSSIIGIGLILCAATVWSVCNLIVKIKRPNDMLAFMVWSSLFSAPAIFVMTILVKGIEPFTSLPQTMDGKAWFSVLFQAYIITILSYILWNNLMKKYPATSVAPLSLLVPIAGISSTYFFFDEQIGIYKGTAMLIILVGLTVFMNAHRINLKREY